MTTQHLGICADTHFPATNKVAYFRGRFAFDGTLTATHANSLQLGPGVTISDALDMMDHYIRAVLLATMPLLRGAMLQHHLRGKFAVQGTLHGGLHILQQMLLIAFHRQDIVPAA